MKLDRQKFERWLKAKKPDEIVGRSSDGCGCPLATFYADASGGAEVVISSSERGCGTGYVIDRGYGSRQLPLWADAFAFLIDRGSERGSKVSAASAMETLKEIDR